MSEKRVTVWVQKFKERSNLMLQWSDPFTGQRKSKSAETNIRAVAEMKRTELEYELNHGLHKEASRMSWERFRELFEAECVSGRRQNTRDNYAESLDAFERLCNPSSLRDHLRANPVRLRRRPAPPARLSGRPDDGKHHQYPRTVLAGRLPAGRRPRRGLSSVQGLYRRRTVDSEEDHQTKGEVKMDIDITLKDALPGETPGHYFVRKGHHTKEEVAEIKGISVEELEAEFRREEATYNRNYQ
jgi:hypothetical protein